MDNFIDKLTQKFSAGEVIRANQMAEEQEMQRLQSQVTEYEDCLQEMRKLQLRHAETAEGLKQLMEENRKAVQTLTQESLEKVSSIKGDKENDAEKFEEELARLLGTLEENQKSIAEWFKQADDFLHKENVKVYRNVQAVVVEEAKTTAEAVLAGQETIARKYYKKMMWVMVITLIAAVGGIAAQIFNIMGIF